MIGIYKATNKLNNKSYIGLSTRLEKRIYAHHSLYNWNRENSKVFYQAIKKYGIENFTFEILETCSKEELGEKERYYIEKYDTYHNGYNMTSGGESNIGSAHPKHKLDDKDVIDIRTRYNNLERCKEVYKLYKDRIGPSGFNKIWKGETWTHLMMEVYTPENKDYHLHDTGNSGSENGRAMLDENDVRIIRTRRKNGESPKKVYKDYKDKLTYGSFKNTWLGYNWKNIVV